MSLLKKYYSYESLDDSENYSTMKDLLDTVERNQKRGMYMRGGDDRTDINSHIKISGGREHINQLQPDFNLQSQLWFNNWQRLHNELEQKNILTSPMESSRRSPSMNYHARFISRRSSVSPVRTINLRFIRHSSEQPTATNYCNTELDHRYHPFHVHLAQPPHHRYYCNTSNYGPTNSNRGLLSDEARLVTAREVQRKIAESHKDLATLKTMIKKTFGGNEDDHIYDDYGTAGYWPTTTSPIDRVKLDPEVLLDTIERRRRHSLPSSYYHPLVIHFPMSTIPSTHQDIKQVVTKPLEFSGQSRITVDIGDRSTPVHRPLPIYKERLSNNYYWHNPVAHPISYPSSYYDRGYIISPYSLLPSLDLAASNSFRLKPETSYFTMDKSRQNMLVRSRLPLSRPWSHVRSRSAVPTRLAKPIARHYYNNLTHVGLPIFHRNYYHTDKYSDLLNLEKIKLGKLESLPSYYDYHRPVHHKSHKTDHDDDLDDHLLRPTYYKAVIPSYRYNYPLLPTSHNDSYHTHRHRNYPRYESLSFSPYHSAHHTRATSLPPLHHHHEDVLPKRTSPAARRTIGNVDLEFSSHKTDNLETLDKILNEMEEQNTNEYYSHNYSTYPHQYYYNQYGDEHLDEDTSLYHHFHPKHDYEYYRKIYRNKSPRLLRESNEELVGKYLENIEQPKEMVYKPLGNTVYKDGYFFTTDEGHSDSGRVILTPPTRITKPGIYLRGSTANEVTSLISKHDFEPRYQRYSVY